jgi:hypothetical protein
MLERSELEFKSIFDYLKEGVLAHEFSVEVQNDPLELNIRPGIDGTNEVRFYTIKSEDSAYGDLQQTRGRGWLSFELSNIEPCKIYDPTTSGYIPTYGTEFYNTPFSIPVERENSLIIVRDQKGDEIPREYYDIDYRDCRIRWPISTTPSGSLSNVPTSIDHRFHMVSILDGYPTDEEPSKMPMICLYPLSENTQGYQIGPGIKSENKYCIDVFASSNSEKRNILNLLKNSLYNKKAPVIDYNRTGETLKQWGVVNDQFIQDIDSNGQTYRSYLTLNPGNGQSLYFVDIEVQHDAFARSSRSGITRHMGKIVFKTKTYSDRDPDLVGKFSELNPPPGGFDSLVLKNYSS